MLKPEETLHQSSSWTGVNMTGSYMESTCSAVTHTSVCLCELTARHKWTQDSSQLLIQFTARAARN